MLYILTEVFVRGNLRSSHYVKSVQIGSFFWSVSLRIQSECGKIRTKKNSVFGHFSVELYESIL